MKNSNSISARLLRSVQFCALLGMFLSLCGNAWGECYIVDESITHQESTKSNGTSLYSYTCNSGEFIRSFSADVSGYYTSSTFYGMDIDLQYNNGGTWTTVAFYSPKTSKNKNGSISYNFTSNSIANVSQIRVITTSDHGGKTHAANTNYSVSNVKITRATIFSATSGSLSIPTTSAGMQKDNAMTINYANLDGQTVSATVTGTNASMFTANLSKSTLDCSGSFITTVTFDPALGTAAGNYTATINLSCGGQNCSFDVTATVTEALISSISWDQPFTSLLSIGEPDPIILNATVVDRNGPVAGAAIVYTSADPSVVSIAGNVLTIVGDGRTTITATYTSDDENVRTSASNTKQVFVSDGSVCNTFLVNETNKVSISSYTGTKSYSWTAPAVSTFTFSIWKQLAGTQDAEVVCKDAAGNTLATYSYSNSSLPTKATMQTKALPAGTKKIEFSADGTLDKYFQNVLVEQATYLEKITTDLGNVQGDNSANASVNFKYSNVPTPISASLEGESTIAVSATPVGTGCGDWNDNATINLVFTPKTTGQRQYTYNGNVVLSAGANDGLKTIEIPVSITIDMPYGDLNSGFAMFYNEDEVAVDVDAYTASWDLSGQEVQIVLDQVPGNVLPAQTPVLLHHDSKDFYTFTVEPNPTLDAINPNAFVHTDAEFVQDNANYCYYVLANKNSQVAFYKFTGTIPANKVVLVWDMSQNLGAAAPARFDLDMHEDITTGLVPVYENVQNFSGQIFTIMGLPIDDMSQPGIYIVNGQKYIVK